MQVSPRNTRVIRESRTDLILADRFPGRMPRRHTKVS
jgi:hypothetical protein